MSIVVLTKDQVESYVEGELGEQGVALRAEWESDDLVLAQKVDQRFAVLQKELTSELNSRFIAVKERIETVAREIQALEEFVAPKLKEINPHGMEQVGTDLDRKIRQLGEKVDEQTIYLKERVARLDDAIGAKGSDLCHAARLQNLELSEKDIRAQLADAQQGMVTQAGGLAGLEAKLQDVKQLLTLLDRRVDSLDARKSYNVALPPIPATAEDRVRMLEAKLQMLESEHKTTAQALGRAQIHLAALEKTAHDPYGFFDYFGGGEEIGSDTPNAPGERRKLRVVRKFTNPPAFAANPFSK